MGLYLNPGNEAFRQIRNGIYVDKTDLIDYVNSTIETSAKLTSFSRPRRFGKSFAAKMLCAYYDKGCDSKDLFKGLKISKMKSFHEHLNQYDVIYLDITRFIMGFSLLKALEFFVFRKMEMPETKNHLLCGWSQIVIQKITFPLQ